MALKDMLFALGGDEARRTYDFKQKRRVTEGLANYLGRNDEAGLQQAYDADPVTAFNAQGQMRQRQQAEADRRRTEFERRARFVRNLPPEQRAMAYPQIRAQYAQIDPETASMLPEQWSEELLPALDELLGGGQGASGVQSTYIDAAGNRVAVLRDGSTRVLGQSDVGMANQTIEVMGPDGRPRRMTFNKRTGEYEPASMSGGYPQPSPQPAPEPVGSGAPQQFDINDPTINALPEETRLQAGRLMAMGVPFYVDGGRVVVGESPGLRTPATEPMPPQAAPPTMQPPNTGGGDPFVGRSAEEEAAAKKEAELRAQLRLAPEIAAADAERQRQIKAAEAQAERDAAGDKKQAQASETIAALNQAIELLPKASGGLLESARDRAYGLVNVATEGAKATAELKLLSAKLVGNVPRFEGPQSNIDVQFYREAAGDLANDQLPVETRLAAARRMLLLAQKAEAQQAAPDDDIDALISEYAY